MYFIKDFLERFRLDSEDLDHRQFAVAVRGNEIVGFGRIRTLGGIAEVATLGVVEGERNQGIGTKIVKHLVDVSPSDKVYVTTDIPRLFEKMGFKKVDKGPCQLIYKINGVCKAKGRGDSIIMVHEKGKYVPADDGQRERR